MRRRFELRCDDAFLAAIDDWRGRQRPILSQAAAIRLLALRGAAADQFLEVVLRETDAALSRMTDHDAEIIAEKYERWKDVVVQSLDHAAQADLPSRSSAAAPVAAAAPGPSAAPERRDQDTFAPRRRRVTR